MRAHEREDLVIWTYDKPEFVLQQVMIGSPRIGDLGFCARRDALWRGEHLIDHVIENERGRTDLTLGPLNRLVRPLVLSAPVANPASFHLPVASTSLGLTLSQFIDTLSIIPHANPQSFAGVHRRPQA